MLTSLGNGFTVVVNTPPAMTIQRHIVVPVLSMAVLDLFSMMPLSIEMETAMHRKDPYRRRLFIPSSQVIVVHLLSSAFLVSFLEQPTSPR